MRTIKGNKITWIDVFKPTDEDVAAIRKVHRFHPIILDELLHPSPRTHLEHYDSYLFLVYHFPEYDPEAKTSRRSEIDVLITKDTITTIHYENLEQLNLLFDLLSRNQRERERVLTGDTLLATHALFEKAITFSLRQLRHIEEQVGSATQEVFTGQEEQLLRKISFIKRNILDYRLIIHPQEKFFTSLQEIGLKFWGPKSKAYLSDLLNDNLPVHRNLENYFQTIESIETTNAQLLDAQTNKIIKRFTVGAFLTSIPLYFVFFLSIEYVHDLLASTPARFWTLFVLVHGVVISLWIIFRRRKII